MKAYYPFSDPSHRVLPTPTGANLEEVSDAIVADSTEEHWHPYLASKTLSWLNRRLHGGTDPRAAW